MEDKLDIATDELDNLSDDNMFNDNLNYDYMDGEYGQSPMAKHNDLLKELTNFDPIIQARIKNWLGLEWDDKLGRYDKKNEAIMNERGVRWAVGFLQTYQAKPNIMTNISQDEFKYMRKDIVSVVWLDFLSKTDFGVRDNQDVHRLATELEHAAFLVLAGAGDGKYTKFLGQSVQRTENVQLSDPRMQYPNAPPSKSGNWFDGFKKKLIGV